MQGTVVAIVRVTNDSNGLLLGERWLNVPWWRGTPAAIELVERTDALVGPSLPGNTPQLPALNGTAEAGSSTKTLIPVRERARQQLSKLHHRRGRAK